MVMHWNTVSMAKAKLSKLVMPCLGPSQPGLHTVPFWHCRPWPVSRAQGEGSSSAGTSQVARGRDKEVGVGERDGQRKKREIRKTAGGMAKDPVETAQSIVTPTPQTQANTHGARCSFRLPSIQKVSAFS